MENIKVLAISGSLREKSYNTALIHAAMELKPDAMIIESHSLADLPLYNEDEDRTSAHDSVRIFKDKIRESDSLLIACPEYNFSVTGALKNAMDWASRPAGTSVLEKKPYAVMGAAGGTSGTIRAQTHFRQIAQFSNMFGMNKPSVYVTFAKQKFNEKLELTDEPTREHLTKFLAAFYDWTIAAKRL